MRFRSLALVSLLSAALLGCASSTVSREGSPAPAEAGDRVSSELVVDNTTSDDMEIFLRSRGQAVPLGVAPASRTTSFKLARAMFSAGQTVVFEARPASAAASSRASVSEPVPIRPGEPIYFRVTP